MTDTAPERNFITAVLIRMFLAAWLGLCCAAKGASAQPLVFLVQSPSWREKLQRFDVQPFAQHLSRALGQPVVVRRSEDVLSHWRSVRNSRGFDLALDQAQFTAYRLSHHGFAVVAREQAEARFAIVVRPRTLITSPTDLSARKVATPAPPALAALRLLNLFPDSVRAPVLSIVESHGQALRALSTGKVAAAVLPMNVAEAVDGVQIALETDASPGRALSVSAAISATQRRKLRDLLRWLNTSETGRVVLSKLAISRFEPVSGLVYEDSEQLLKGTWGYSKSVGKTVANESLEKK